MQREDCFFIGLGLNAETALVQAHDLARPAQSYSRSLLLGCEEGNSDAVLNFLQYSRAIVGDLDDRVSSAVQIAD